MLHTLAALFAMIPAQTQTPSAQVSFDFSQRMHSAPGPIRNAGVLDLRTGRRSSSQQVTTIGPHVIYNNTCPLVGYPPNIVNGIQAGESLTDEGRVPSPSGSTDYAINKPGCATSYLVNGFEIAYCTDEPFLDARVSFIEWYRPYCSNPANFPELAGFDLPGLPGSATPGTVACWTITIDLGTPPDPGNLAFTLRGDGSGAWTPPSYWENCFGYTFKNVSAPGANFRTGPVIAGDYTQCKGWDGTLFDPILNYAERGTGMGTIGGFYATVNPPSFSGCVYGPVPIESLYLRLFSTGCPLEPGTYYCEGNPTTSGLGCPCGNNTQPGFHQGCYHSSPLNQGPGGHLRAHGTASLSADTLELHASGYPQQTTVLFFQGTTQVDGGAGSFFGDGKRCAGGSVIRLATKIDPGGSALTYPVAGEQPVSVRGQISAPGFRTYQVWYRNAADHCTPATFNTSNGYMIQWAP